MHIARLICRCRVNLEVREVLGDLAGARRLFQEWIIH